MKIFVISIVLLILLIAGILQYRNYYVDREVRKLAADKYKIFEPLLAKLSAKEPVTGEEILLLAKDSSMRLAVYGMLKEFGKEDLFPEEYLTQEKAAESFLVNWLEFPTELGTAPNEMELLTKIPVDGNDESVYYVFKYRTIAPHWSSRYNWMIGVTGPYGHNAAPYAVPLRVFSRFKAVGSVTAETEVNWVHENIGKSGT